MAVTSIPKVELMPQYDNTTTGLTFVIIIQRRDSTALLLEVESVPYYKDSFTEATIENDHCLTQFSDRRQVFHVYKQKEQLHFSVHTTLPIYMYHIYIYIIYKVFTKNLIQNRFCMMFVSNKMGLKSTASNHHDPFHWYTANNDFM